MRERHAVLLRRLPPSDSHVVQFVDEYLRILPERPVQLDYLVYVSLLVDIGFEQEYVRFALFEQAAVFDQSLDLRLPCFGELLDRKALETGSFVANALVLDIIESYPLELPPGSGRTSGVRPAIGK